MGAYEKIMNKKGLDEFQRLVTKWKTLSEGIEARSTGLPIILPDIFLISPSGTGRTMLLSLLAEFLSERRNLLEFYGDVKYFEFMLNYCRPEEPFTEITRLMSQVNVAAGFRNEYKGILFIDVDEWLGHFNEKHFISFLEYLSDNSDDWMVVLSVLGGKKQQARDMETVLSAFLRIETITVEEPTTPELLYYFEHLLERYGFSLSEDGRELVVKTVEKLKKNEYFDGYKTTKRFCQDVVYTVYASGVPQNTVLDSAALERFAPDGAYANRTAPKLTDLKKIGF